MPHAPLTTRAPFRHWAREICRYGDTDRQGHVNNAVFATFCETGRVMFLRGDPVPLVSDAEEFVIVKLTIEFRGELHWTDEVDIGTNVTRIGRTSFVMGQGLFHGPRCVATGESVLVLLDSASRRPTPLPDTLRAWLAAHMPDNAA